MTYPWAAAGNRRRAVAAGDVVLPKLFRFVRRIVRALFGAMMRRCGAGRQGCEVTMFHRIPDCQSSAEQPWAASLQPRARSAGRFPREPKVSQDTDSNRGNRLAASSQRHGRMGVRRSACTRTPTLEASTSQWPTKRCGWTGRGQGQLLRGDLILAGGTRYRRARHPPGLWISSENESFAQACARCRHRVHRPPPFAIHAMGSKSEARRLMERARYAGPGLPRRQAGPGVPARAADSIGYPVLISERGRRRQGHAGRQCNGGVQCRTRVVPARSQGGRSGRSRADREVRRAARAISRSRCSPTRGNACLPVRAWTARCSAVTKRLIRGSARPRHDAGTAACNG